jgi:hypothetical protein
MVYGIVLAALMRLTQPFRVRNVRMIRNEYGVQNLIRCALAADAAFLEYILRTFRTQKKICETNVLKSPPTCAQKQVPSGYPCSQNSQK